MTHKIPEPKLTSFRNRYRISASDATNPIGYRDGIQSAVQYAKTYIENRETPIKWVKVTDRTDESLIWDNTDGYPQPVIDDE